MPNCFSLVQTAIIAEMQMLPIMPISIHNLMQHAWHSSMIQRPHRRHPLFGYRRRGRRSQSTSTTTRGFSSNMFSDSCSSQLTASQVFGDMSNFRIDSSTSDLMVPDRRQDMFKRQSSTNVRLGSGAGWWGDYVLEIMLLFIPHQTYNMREVEFSIVKQWCFFLLFIRLYPKIFACLKWSLRD